jgi:hypothetical protein
MWRALLHRAAFVHQGVAGAHRGAYLGHEETALAGEFQNLAQRHVEIFLNIVAERFERRDVQNLGLVLDLAGERLAHQAINACEKGRKSLTGTRRSANQRVLFGQNVGPALLLRFRRRAEFPREPLAHERMSPFEAGNC